jgi:tRNA(Ile2) C34 agmatinyltransferase TiaS
MVEHLVKRTIFVSKCPQCGDSVEREENPPRERRCNQCKIWVPYVQQEYIGKDLGKGK